MANDGAASIYGVRLRAARLAADGSTPAGASNGYCTDAFVKVTFTPDIRAGAEQEKLTADGVACVQGRARDTYKRWNVDVEICAPDPELTELISGGVVLSSAVSALTTPTLPTVAASASGGVLATGSYNYKITALNGYGETLPSPNAASPAAVTGPTGSVTVSWSAVSGAVAYRIYGRTAGSEALLTTVYGVLSWVDTGALSPAGMLPTVNTTAPSGTIGYGAPVVGAIPNQGVALEVWSRAYRGATPTGDYHWWTLPKCFLMQGERNVEAADMNVPFSGYCDPNPNYLNGAWNDWPAASDRCYQQVRTTLLPPAQVGYITTLG